MAGQPFTLSLIQKETDMKNLMITTAASALLFGAAACSQASDDIQVAEAPYEETQTAEQTNGTDMTEMDMAEAKGDAMEAEVVYLADTDVSAEELTGAKVIGVNGEDIATVDDLLINSDGKVESIIFKSGDFLDITGKKGAISYDQVDLTITADNEPRFTVGMTEDAIQNVAEFEQDGMNDYRLASEIIGTTADFTRSDDSTRIRDIIVGQDGTVEYAVVSDPLMMEDMRQLDFSLIQVEQGDGGKIVIDAAKTDFEMMPVFAYEMEDTEPTQDNWDDDMSEDETLMPEMEDGSDEEPMPQ